MPVSIEYLVFSGVAVAAFTGVHLWLHRRDRRAGLPPAAAAAAVAILLAGGWLVSRNEHQTIERLTRAVIGLAPTYAAEIERLGHSRITLQTPADDPGYLALIAAEKRWLALNPVVNDIYTFRRADDEHVALVVDSETDYDHNGRFEGEREMRTEIGEKLALDVGDYQSAMDGEGTFDSTPYADRWGTWVSAYWPLRDAQGRVEAVMGIDYAAAAWVAEVRAARLTAIAVTAIVLLMLLAGMTFYQLQGIELEARRAAAEAARQAREAAESANRLKSQFLACMSHEIRTPMNGVMGVTELLLATRMDSKQKHFGNLIFRSASNLLAIINDILDYSKIEAEKLTLEILPFCPRDVVEDVGELLGPRASGKLLELVINYPVDSPPALRGDAARLRQILTNLVGNAIKFTERGEVAMVVSWRDAADGRKLFCCEVRDTGPGLDEPTMQGLFQPFVQADSSITRRYGGTGLGLAICRKLAELMGGRIGVRSKLGEGSTFWFEIPLEVVTEGVKLPGGAQGDGLVELQGLHGLIVDDNDTNREILEHLLTAWRVRFDSAADADEALRKLEAAATAGDPFQFAILDHQMPGRDGLQLAGDIREHPALVGTRLLMLSSNAASEGERDWRESGVDVYMTKPVRHAVLFRELRQLLGSGEAAGSTAETGTMHAPQIGDWAPEAQFAGRVLLAEDNSVNQLIAEEMLSSLGFEVEVVGDGRQAVEAAATTAVPFVAILMDCEMPNLDGRSATLELRRQEVATAAAEGREPLRVPVIALTAHAADSDREACLAAGMDDYLSKPMTRAQLEMTLARWVPRVAAAAAGSGGPDDRPERDRAVGG